MTHMCLISCCDCGADVGAIRLVWEFGSEGGVGGRWVTASVDMVVTVFNGLRAMLA